MSRDYWGDPGSVALNLSLRCDLLTIRDKVSSTEVIHQPMVRECVIEEKFKNISRKNVRREN